MIRVLLAGGGTAGHVNPLLAVAHALEEHGDVALCALGTSQGLEARLIPDAGLKLVEIPRAAMPRRLSGDWLSFPPQFSAALAGARRAIEDLNADVVVGFGGYVSTPAYIAAHRLGIPIVVHEANSRPGLANRVGARWASAVLVAFPSTSLRHAEVVGMPLRHEITSLDRALMRAESRKELGLNGAKPTLLVTGGSLGAQRLNRVVATAAGDLLRAGIQVLHLTGKGKDTEVMDALSDVEGRDDYHVRPYLDRIELAYAASDLIICRAGASTVCELAAVGAPAVYIPLPIGNGEQKMNALPLVEAEGGLLVDDADFSPYYITNTIIPVMAEPQRLVDMGVAAAALGIRDSAQQVANVIVEIAS
jgi:undecaprenyldiphospho-muramoylpentapeptide beta-N-acetylglucosaminyltransferase